MLNKKLFSIKIRYLIIGIVIGVSIMSSALVFANTPITAWVASNIGFYFNDQFTELPQGYDVILHNGRVYTPARFVAEELGAEVVWDEATNRIYINYEEIVPEVPSEKAIDIDEEKEEKETETETEETQKRKKNYQKLPINITAEDGRIAVTSVSFDNNETIVYIEVEGRKNYPIQLDQSAARIETEEEIYRQSELQRTANPVDTKWYNDIRDEERVTGWIKFPPMPEDTKEMTLYLEIFRNDGSKKTTELELDIAL
ncbi:Copper amine oxidase N-terminal domain-containing protein [Anaerovirgula multivorans]|uniref:Copper amine oxidase N-terminal domain-containing protein n=1 Tax=Anaerovirgula multivorans TaxID=312168 RepID=A0A239EH35_9FIRM|nr:stalk domain-containing protein [Anaerovirgula multivorans]SNS43947.1 Copper amine oxidase N-terminal domain-containing protein [Anaerovirgula multivorans]